MKPRTWAQVLLDRWIHDAPPNVLRFPIFDESTPYPVIAAACTRFRRRAYENRMTSLIYLEKVPA